MMQLQSPPFLELNQLQDFLDHSKYSQVYALVDSNTLALCLPQLLSALKEPDLVQILEVDAGEQSKDLEICFGLWQSLLDNAADRHTLILNLGGGVITDLGGFIASTYKRGIDFIHIPTTLLGQVDAAIGGKTGIDLGSFKNVVGTFASARAIIINPSFLDTLPEVEVISGFAETIKHALVADSGLWNEIVGTNSFSLDLAKNTTTISAQIKLKIVGKDPLEKNERKKLNFGHTVGHSIESELLKKGNPIPHGFAIYFGMLTECYLSEKLNKCDLSEVKSKLIEWMPNIPSDTLDKNALWVLMLNDKKNEGGEVRCVLLKSIGLALIDQSISQEDFFEAFDLTLNNLIE